MNSFCPQQQIGLIITIIIGQRFILSLVLIPFKCPLGIYFHILSCESQSQISRRCLLFTLPAPAPHAAVLGSRVPSHLFVALFLELQKRNATEALFFAKKLVSAGWRCHLCVPLGSLAVGSHTSEDKEGLFHGQPASRGPAACPGSSLPAHEPAQKSQVLWAPVSRELYMLRHLASFFASQMCLDKSEPTSHWGRAGT